MQALIASLSGIVMRLLPLLPWADLISHRFPLDLAEQAYRLLDEQPADALQVVLTYPNADR